MMKKLLLSIFLLSIFVLYLVTNKDNNLEKSSTVLQDEPVISTVLQDEPATATPLKSETLEKICNSNFYPIEYCSDGSEIIRLFSSDLSKIFYIHHNPNDGRKNRFNFFNKLTYSNEIIYNKDDSIEIPVCINETNEYRFIINASKKTNEDVVIDDLIFLNKEDEDFNNMYSKLNNEQQKDYRLSLVPDKSLSNGELTKFLKACVYNGNMSVLKSLYELIPNDYYYTEERHKIELAATKEPDSSIKFSDTNPYIPEIFYEENYELFPQQDTLKTLAKSLQTGESLIELGFEKVEPNYDWDKVSKIPNLEDFFSDESHKEWHLKTGTPITEDCHPIRGSRETWRVYNLDLNKDCRNEILAIQPYTNHSSFLPYWSIFFLDETGNITRRSSAQGVNEISLYRFQGNYVFLSANLNLKDGEFKGYSVCVLDNEGKIYESNILFEKTMVEVVYDDIYSNPNSISNTEINILIDEYKRFEENAIGNIITPNEQILASFKGSEYSLYGVLDVNNDGIDDWTLVTKYQINGEYLFNHYFFVDGQRNKLIDFSYLFNKNDIVLRYVKPIRDRYNTKNCFLCVFYGNSNYVIKLIMFNRMNLQPIEMQDWLVTTRNRIIVSISEII